MKNRNWSILVALLVILAAGSGVSIPAWGQARTTLPAPGPPLHSAEHPEQQVLDVNAMTTWVRRDGLFGWFDPRSGLNGTYPKDQPVGVVFGQGLVWGGHVRDGRDTTLRVGGGSYRSGLQAGKVLFEVDGSTAGADDPQDQVKYHVWRVHRNWKVLDYDEAAVQFFGVAADEVSETQRAALQAQYAYDWEHWPAELGAPYDDVDGDGAYDPDVDVPGEPGADQTLWLVANDLNPEVVRAAYGAPPIGIEHQLTLWGYDDPDTTLAGALRNLHFRRSRLIYTGTPDTPEAAAIDSMFVAFWADPDVGHSADDFCGVDLSRGLGFVYNSRARDAAYDTLGLSSPAVGWDLVKGPRGDEGHPLNISTFFCDRAGDGVVSPYLGGYEGTLQWYNFMRGVQPEPRYPRSEPFVNPLTDERTPFVLTGDPINRTGWVDGVELPPGNRSLHMAAGPFTMHRGDTVDVVISQVAALGESNLSSLSVLHYYDDVSQDLYDTRGRVTERRNTPEVDGHAVVEGVYPNPSRGGVQFVLNARRSGRYTVVVYDLLGRRVKTRRLAVGGPEPRRVALDLSGRAAGTYLLVVEDERGIPAGHCPVTIVP